MTSQQFNEEHLERKCKNCAWFKRDRASNGDYSAFYIFGGYCHFYEYAEYKTGDDSCNKFREPEDGTIGQGS